MNDTIFDPYQFSHKEIHGVPVYYKNLPWAPCIHIRIAFNVGAFHDPVGKEGLAHFVEHMVYEGGSKTTPDEKAVREWSKKYTLNTWNAWTNFNQTVYWCKCLPDHYETVLTGMKDMIFAPFFKKEMVEKERGIITQEAWERYKNKQFLAFIREVLPILYPGHERERVPRALGWPETIQNISHDDLKGLHQTYYGTKNMYIVLAGAVDETSLKAIETFLANLPQGNDLPPVKTNIEKPTASRITKSSKDIGDPTEQVEITLSRSATPIGREKLEINRIFSSLLGDMLNERLRIEHNLCYGVHCGGSNHKTFFEFGANVKTEEKNIDLVLKEFWDIVQELKDKKYLDRFNLIKQTRREGILAREMLSADIIDDVVGYVSTYNGQIVTNTERLSLLEKVTYDDIIQFASWALDPEFICTEIILPEIK